MVKKTLSFGLGLFLALVTAFGEAQATLLAVDDFSYGTPVWGAPVTLDSTTGLEWLNIQITSLQAPSYAELQSWLSPGGKLSGWKLASAAQVFTLMGDAGLPDSIFGFRDTTGRYASQITSFQNLLGGLVCWDGYRYTWGMVRDSPAPDEVAIIGLGSWGLYEWGETVFSESSLMIQSIGTYDSCNYAGADPVGAWLVREADTITTPEPSTMLLLSGGLFALAVLRRRKEAPVLRIA